MWELELLSTTMMIKIDFIIFIFISQLRPTSSHLLVKQFPRKDSRGIYPPLPFRYIIQSNTLHFIHHLYNYLYELFIPRPKNHLPFYLLLFIFVCKHQEICTLFGIRNFTKMLFDLIPIFVHK